MAAAAAAAVADDRPAAEAAASDAERRIKEALECPCLDDLKGGSCGSDFTAGARAWPACGCVLPTPLSHALLTPTTTTHAAIGCFMRSAAPEKGTDCAEAFLTLQARAHCFPGILSTCVTHAYCPAARRLAGQDMQTSMLP